MHFQKIQDLWFLFCFGREKRSFFMRSGECPFFLKNFNNFLLLRATKISILIGRPTLMLFFSG